MTSNPDNHSQQVGAGVNTHFRIQTYFKNYRRYLRHIWEDAVFVESYASILHNKIRDGEIEPVRIGSVLSSHVYPRTVNTTLGIISRIRNVSNSRRAFLEAISAFEEFLSHMVLIVHTDYPGKLISITSASEPLQDIKLIEIVVKSGDRQEILSRIIEERIRSIFYGNPLDFFVKDKAKLEFGDYFRAGCKPALLELQEILARRNILVHNGGRVDRKYLREVRDAHYELEHKVYISTPYLRASIALFDGLGAAVAGLVLRNIYNMAPQGPLARSWHSFEKRAKLPSLP